jgi:hypothetical protein
MSFSTLAEIQRCCKKIASTDTDYHEYNRLKIDAQIGNPFQFIVEWDEVSIYSNELYYIVCQTRGNILSLYTN